MPCMQTALKIFPWWNCLAIKGFKAKNYGMDHLSTLTTKDLNKRRNNWY